MVAKAAICQYCSKPIKSGRSDKKFCGSGCKDAYYNAIKSEELKEISKIDAILKRNRRVLKKLFNPKKEGQLFTREKLVKDGFEFGFHTHIVITSAKSNEIIFCYDYGFREVRDQKYQIYPSYSQVNIKDGEYFKVR